MTFSFEKIHSSTFLEYKPSPQLSLHKSNNKSNQDANFRKDTHWQDHHSGRGAL